MADICEFRQELRTSLRPYHMRRRDQFPKIPAVGQRDLVAVCRGTELQAIEALRPGICQCHPGPGIVVVACIPGSTDNRATTVAYAKTVTQAGSTGIKMPFGQKSREVYWYE